MIRLLLSALIVLVMVLPALARDIVDMAGRTVTVPDHINRVVGCVAPVNWMIYAVAPMKLAAFTSRPSEADWQILDSRLKDRPVIGSFLGGQGVNQETLLAIDADVVIFWGDVKSPLVQRWLRQLDQWHIPVVFVAMDRLEDYPATLEFLGHLLGAPQRGLKLARYGRCILEQVATIVATIPASQRRRVYYAQGNDGLETEPEQSFHAELIGLAGGCNVHKGVLKQRRGRDKISLEQVLMYNPEVILTAQRDFYEHVVDMPTWQQVQALRNDQVLLIPDYPLNWFDRPPSMMRFLGLQWLVKSLYPQTVHLDMVETTRHFYQLFFGLNLSDERVRDILDVTP
ncbi:ABC transporter substrate-binding protein [uncultured Desulfuromonas sp.]|uniref:ABC transporter substrate-binding protein n=1 Tax=uncultured Desulfuromonas sp. TaxID=181013 RepID=UPI002AAB62D9|nr:ABC transporter substrate-binding protein [uncultured Desulfuromonas sp.]